MKNFSENIQKLETEIETAEAIVIGAGAGISVSSGFVILEVALIVTSVLFMRHMA